MIDRNLDQATDNTSFGEKEISRIVRAQKSFFDNGFTFSYSFRKNALVRLKDVIKSYESEIVEALGKDVGKSETEAYMTELATVYGEFNYFAKNLRNLMKPEKSEFSMATFPSQGKIYKDAYGCILIMSPWNYPFQLAIMPLIGAIAAGNCAVVKPSAYAPATSAILKSIIDEAFDENYVSCITGGREENSKLLDEAFDYIFFTGGSKVGKFVLEKAAKNLTPITLELGGKSPVIIDKSANIEMVARRIVWGKFLNCGQTCVAPDYVLVHKSVKEQFIERAEAYIRALYGENPLNSPNYGKIINSKHLYRLEDNLKNQNIIVGGVFDYDRLKLSPTIVDEPFLSDRIMREEIFGPILPIISYEDFDGAIGFIKSRPKPLAFYIFAENKKVISKAISGLSFGGGCVNDTIMHLATEMPFGGVGASGMGSYHGRYSYETFSRRKSVLYKKSRFDLPIRYDITKNSFVKGTFEESGFKLMKYVSEDLRLRLIKKFTK